MFSFCFLPVPLHKGHVLETFTLTIISENVHHYIKAVYRLKDKFICLTKIIEL